MLTPALTVRAVELRKFGQDIIYQVGGRRIHPNFAVPGGVNRALTEEKRDHMLAGLDQAIETTQIGIQLIKDWASANIEDIEKFAVFHTGYMGLVTTPRTAWNSMMAMSAWWIEMANSWNASMLRITWTLSLNMLKIGLT